ncbi:unnamed protein product [Clonostachys solani]|uniref:DUF4185 domain-containing protein n=1 Tax=Clonostachys solani TaxID=160281 RepID=A0A9P0ELA6_9HYPO|nr:unnamed protein product [Clonostachys solani]
MFDSQTISTRGLLAAAIIGSASAYSIPRDTFTPTIKGTPQVLGLVSDPSLNRDSCGSVRFQTRDFWTCRDTQVNDEQGRPGGGTISSTAAFTPFNFDGTPYIEQTNIVRMTGDNSEPFYHMTNEQCSACNQCNGNTAGACTDGKSRYALWPDSPPMVTAGQFEGQITAYTWIKNQKIEGLTLLQNNPSAALHKITYDPLNPDLKALPSVSIANPEFWPEGSFAYGSYGNVVNDGVAYLYAKADDNGKPIALAKVAADSVEDKSKYQYWVGNSWTSNQPSISDSNAHLVNAGAGGQGTYYYYEPWSRYVWIGQAGISISAEFFITTAAEPQGPWSQPTLLYKGVDGNATLPAYSLQAHPTLRPGSRNEIYLTYSKVDRWDGVELDVYSTPLIRIEWE